MCWLWLVVRVTMTSVQKHIIHVVGVPSRPVTTLVHSLQCIRTVAST